MNIAICDDDIKFCSYLETILLDYGKIINCKFNVEVFYSGEELCEYMIKKSHFELLFLDIELKELDGIQLGLYIRNVLKNDAVHIVYVSSYIHYAMRLFKIRPLDFLLKPVKVDEVHEIIDTSMELSDKLGKFFTYQIKKESYGIQLREILYFQCSNREILLYHKTGDSRFYGTLQQIYHKLSKFHFIYIHKSYIVNIQHVKRLEGNNVVMSNQQVLPIGGKYKSSMLAYLEENEVFLL